MWRQKAMLSTLSCCEPKLVVLNCLKHLVYLIGFKSLPSHDPAKHQVIGVSLCRYLQYEDEVVHGFAAQVKVVVRRFLVVLIEFDILDHVRVFKDTQKDFL